jgi:hypothetical protein
MKMRIIREGAHGDTVRSGTGLQARSLQVQFLMVSACSVSLGSVQILMEMNTRNIFWGGKGGWCVGLTTFTTLMC